MRNWIAAALLASAALASPALAQDDGHGPHGGDRGGEHGGGQNGGGDRRGGGQGGGQGGDRGGGAPRWAPQAEHGPQGVPARGGNPVMAPPQRGPSQPRGGPAGYPYGGVAGRPDFRGQPGGGPGGDQPRAVPRAPVRQGWGGPPPGDGRHVSARVDGDVTVWQGQGRAGGDPRFAGGPHAGPQGAPQGGPRDERDGGHRWDGRHDDHPNGYDRRGFDPHGGYDHHGYDPRSGYAQGGHGGDWNRGWRQDRRYDWQGWRAEHRNVFRVERYRAPYGYGGYRRFGLGYRLPPIFFAEQYWIDDPYYYRLPPAYGEYRWVRYYNDALLIDLDDGEIVDAIPNFFYY